MQEGILVCPLLAALRTREAPGSTNVSDTGDAKKARRTALTTAAAAIASALVVSPVHAQANRTDASTLPEVVVRDVAERADGPVQGYRATRSGTFTRTDTPLKDVPASVTVVPEEVMSDMAMRGMNDVFRYVPGAIWHQGEGNRDQVVLRGNSTTADFFVDGVRDDAQIFRDLYNVERVEVLKGPSGMAFGRGGAGGVVNRVTKKPIFERVAEASVTAGSWNQIRGALDLGNKLTDAAAWRLNAMYESSGSYRNGFNLERFAFNPTTSFALDADTMLTLGYEHLHDTRTADRGIPSFRGTPLATDVSTFFGNAAQSDARSTSDGLYAVFERSLANGMQFRNTTRYTHYDKFYQNVYPGSEVNAAGTLTLSAYNNANQRSNVFNQSDLIRTLTTGSMTHTLLVGAEVGHQNSVNKRNTGFFGASTGAVVAASNPYAIATAFRPNGTDADNEAGADMAALYAQDQIKLSPAWKAILGLRYDYFRVRFDDRRTTMTATDLQRTDQAFSPRAGLLWSPDARSTYYVSYGYAFLPSGEQLALATTTADLEPEKSINYEIGGRWELTHKLMLSSALFRTDRLDVKVTDPANPGTFVKSGHQRTDGLEVGLQGDITSAWSVYGGYAYMDGRVLSAITSGTTASAAAITPAGNRVGLVPRNTFSLWNRVNIGPQWGAGLGVIYQSDYYTSFTNTVSVPSFVRFDGALYYTMSDKTRIALNVENIFNRKYYPTADGDNNITPGAPVNARLTLSTRF